MSFKLHFERTPDSMRFFAENGDLDAPPLRSAHESADSEMLVL